MLVTVHIKFAGTDQIKTIKNVPLTVNVGKLIKTIVKQYYPETNYLSLKAIFSGKIVQFETKLEELGIEEAQEATIYVSGLTLAKTEKPEISEKTEEEEKEEEIVAPRRRAPRKIAIQDEPKNEEKKEIDEDEEEVIVVEKIQKQIQKRKTQQKVVRRNTSQTSATGMNFFHQNKEETVTEKNLKKWSKILAIVIVIMAAVVGFECVLQERGYPKGQKPLSNKPKPKATPMPKKQKSSVSKEKAEMALDKKTMGAKVTFFAVVIFLLALFVYKLSKAEWTNEKINEAFKVYILSLLPTWDDKKFKEKHNVQ